MTYTITQEYAQDDPRFLEDAIRVTLALKGKPSSLATGTTAGSTTRSKATY